MAEQERWFVYVLRCKGDRLYCGIAKNVDARFAEHAAGKGAKFTRGFPPVAIVATLQVADRAEALKREAAFKRMAKLQKLEALRDWRAGNA